MARSSLLTPFEVRGFRFQWPADLLTSWAIEMEILILGWYIVVETGSVLLLTAFGSLQYLGTLIAPLFGMAGDRFGHRTVLCAMRASYAALAVAVSILVATGSMTPLYVLFIAGFSGLVRPSDLAMRNALVAETMPPDRLMAAMGVSRTTSDSARIVGSLAGAGLLAAMGMGPAYVAIAVLYAVGLVLTMGVSSGRGATHPIGVARPTFLREVREGMVHVWRTPCVLAAMILAFLVNMTAFPMTIGLLPYVAREIYHIDQTGLGTLVASFSCGALLGSIAVTLTGRALRPARAMIVFAAAWYAAVLLFANMPGPNSGRALLVAAGFAQSMSMVPMAAMLLRVAGPKLRGRIMGVRMLAIYGLPIGLMGAGVLIPRFGFAATASAYCIVGLAATLAIALYWRRAIWPLDAPANAI